MQKTVGTCSCCGGAVTVPDVWMSVRAPRPSCESCGAYAKQDHGPVVPMEPKRATFSPLSFGDLFPRNVQ